ncbi:MAG: hypothetical protein SOZ52_06675, partial [Pyramidobacter sp.]|nr:hypothetical protein [Pyramidobacter sp.]
KPAICFALENVPPAALEWASDSFQTHLKSIMKQYVPGWKCSVRARAADGDGTLEISLYPAEPVLIAVTPLTVSNTIPQIIADNITKKTLSYLSPLIGMPLPWIRRHEKKVVAWLGDKQLSDGWLQELHASATNTFSIKPLARVQTNIESTTFSLRGWISAHAGGAGARLQAGIHFGRLFTLGSSVPSEVYAEGILGLENWDFSGRFGLRFTPARSVWLGAEVTSGEDSTLWYRLWIHGPGIGPYTWLRYSEDDDIEAALGYRMNRFISMELHYDSRQDDRISLRAVSDM